jgi:hypothetical protein
MSRFQPCPSCACHVKVEDPRCPFCKAPRTCRAQWPSDLREVVVGGTHALALGSAMVLLGCSGAVASTPAGEGGEPGQPGVESAVACPSRSGYFTCGSNVCDRSVQACDERSGTCLSYDALPPSDLVSPGGACGRCPTCACLAPELASNCHCQEDDAGAVSISCGGCYGAPPARLSRVRCAPLRERAGLRDLVHAEA